MQEIIMYLVVIVVSFIIVVFCTKHADTKCREAGGQVITNSANFNHGCIYPAGK